MYEYSLPLSNSHLGLLTPSPSMAQTKLNRQSGPQLLWHQKSQEGTSGFKEHFSAQRPFSGRHMSVPFLALSTGEVSKCLDVITP